MMFARTLALCAVLTANTLGAADEEGSPRESEETVSCLQNGYIKVGVDLSRGGSIGYLADVQRGENVVNVHDLGRWIGQSYYSGPKPFGNAHPAWNGWPWNPVSAGDVYGNPTKLLETRNDGTTIYVKSTPMQWALQGVPAECTFETWISLRERTVRVRNRLTNQRKDERQYPAMDQEVPAVYTIGKLHRLMTYVGDQPFTDQPLSEIPKRAEQGGTPQWTSFTAVEHWAALVDDEGWGLGVIHPCVVQFVGGFYGTPTSGGPEDDPNGYIAPLRQEILDHDIVYEYEYTLVLDRLSNIRQEAYRQRPESFVPDYRFVHDRQHWWYVNASDTGFPINNSLRLQVDQNDPQMFGPHGGWQAKDAPSIFVRAAYHTSNRTAQLFWETAEDPGFRSEQSVQFAIVPDGELRTYEVDLSALSTYRGTIRRLRFDPVETGRPGESVEVESISMRQH